MNRITYAYGMKSRERAEEVLEDCLAAGEISHGEKPEIASYNTRRRDGKRVRRWLITVTAE